MFQDMASDTALASLKLSDACFEMEKLSKQLQAQLTIKNINVDTLTSLQRQTLLSVWQGKLMYKRQQTLVLQDVMDCLSPCESSGDRP